MEPEDIIRRMMIIRDNIEFFDSLEACDSQVFDGTYEMLIDGSCELSVEENDD